MNAAARHARELAGRIGLAVTLLGLLGALVIPTPAQAAREAGPVSIPARYLNQPVDWVQCPFDDFFREIEPSAPMTLCASVNVPMDWQHPDAHPDVSLAVAHSAATGYSKGLLTSNPGGPGAAGLSFTGQLALSKPQLFTDYDLLGFDPRGFGSSEPLRCVTTQAAVDALPSTEDPRLRTRATHRAEVARAKLLSRACAETEFGRFVGTQQTVFDLEFLRRLVGRDQPRYERLNYLGYSYGTWLGTWYADTYPEHTGRFVLDSNMDWTSSMYANQAGDPRSFQRRRDAMFYPWLARHDDTYGLGRSVAEVARSYERIRAGLLAARRRGEFVPTPATADRAIVIQIYLNEDFPAAATTLLELRSLVRDSASRARRARIVAAVERLGSSPLAPDRATRARADEPVYLDDIGEVVRCNDSRYPRTVSRVLRRADRDTRRYPFVGYLNTVSMCNYWPYAPARRTVDLRAAPPLLMVQSEGDPATAYEGARTAHRRVPAHTRLVSVDDEGQHGVYIGGPSPCIEAIGDAFLFHGRLPSVDRVCGTTPLPLDERVYPFAGPLGPRTPTRWASPAPVVPTDRAHQALREARARVAAQAVR